MNKELLQKAYNDYYDWWVNDEGNSEVFSQWYFERLLSVPAGEDFNNKFYKPLLRKEKLKRILDENS